MSKATEELKSYTKDYWYKRTLAGKINAVLDELEQAQALLIETRDKVMRTEENRDWLERRNRLLGWPEIEDYSK
jgi:hypothetical protein